MIDFLFTSKPLVKTSSPHMFRQFQIWRSRSTENIK